jgi:hypothetical protein
MPLARALERLRRFFTCPLALTSASAEPPPVRRTVAAALATFAAVVAMIGGASQAQAQQYCPDGKICMWEDENAEGDRYVDTKVGRPGWFYDIHGWNGDNEISSAQNNTGRIIQAWTNDNPAGRSYCLYPGEYYSSFGSYDNDFESFIVVDRCL